MIGPLEPQVEASPMYAQIYIHDPETENPADTRAGIRLAHCRLPANTSQRETLTLRGLLVDLEEILLQINPWVQDFKTAKDILTQDVEEVQRPQGLREISVLIGNEAGPRDIVIRRRAASG